MLLNAVACGSAMDAKERAQALHYRQQVEALFDDYAPDFEKSLAALGYDVPNEILSELETRNALAHVFQA